MIPPSNKAMQHVYVDNLAGYREILCRNYIQGETPNQAVYTSLV